MQQKASLFRIYIVSKMGDIFRFEMNAHSQIKIFNVKISNKPADAMRRLQKLHR